MPKLYMIRHGRAAAGWDSDPDPGLHEEGHQQAQRVIDHLAGLAPMPIITSPMRRCRETATPLAQHWNIIPQTEPRVSEIESPIPDLAQRTVWLRQLMTGTWSDSSTACQQWRNTVIDTLRQYTEDTVIFSHFVAINAALGAATDDDQVLISHPDYCAITIFSTDSGRLALVEQGKEAETVVR
ncbi:histidine phosphatase family protein [Parvularcula sp. IMCC14364]|uniref:histidine phosphatase family protein n=1 Tax=Parvularcula sp. IMCC14364 TaxID=3067902 RepID=UPI0027407AD2|nr:histidine phosphatase family protein [Parvularcula sp. IMCC14364]